MNTNANPSQKHLLPPFTFHWLHAIGNFFAEMPSDKRVSEVDIGQEGKVQEFYDKHRFRPADVVDEVYAPEKWSSHILGAFLKLSSPLDQADLKAQLKIIVDERYGGPLKNSKTNQPNKYRRLTRTDILKFKSLQEEAASNSSPSQLPESEADATQQIAVINHVLTQTDLRPHHQERTPFRDSAFHEPSSSPTSPLASKVSAGRVQAPTAPMLPSMPGEPNKTNATSDETVSVSDSEDSTPQEEQGFSMELRSSEALSKDSPGVLGRQKREEELHKKGKEVARKEHAKAEVIDVEPTSQKAQKVVTPRQVIRPPRKGFFTSSQGMKRKSDDGGSDYPIKKTQQVVQTSGTKSTMWFKTTEEEVCEILKTQNDRAGHQSAAGENSRQTSVPTASPSPAPDGCPQDLSQPAPERERQSTPESTEKGAASTLEEGMWLSSTAIEMLLDKVPSNNFKIYDAAFLKIDDPEAISKKARVKHWDKVPSIFPVNHSGKHWTLVVMDPKTRVNEFYNSFADPEYEEGARAAINCWVSRLWELTRADISDMDWHFTVQPCPSQNNNSDCGIAVIINAIYRILNLTLPKAIDFGIWRRTFRAVLLHGIPPSQRPKTTESTQLPDISSPASRSISHQSTRRTDPASLGADFHACDYKHKEAEESLRYTSKVLDTIDALLATLQTELETAPAQHDEHSSAVSAYEKSLEYYQPFTTHHAEDVKTALEKSIKTARKDAADCKTRVQNLQRSKPCWEAGRAFVLAEKERQEEMVRSASAKLEGAIQNFDIQDERMEEEEVRLEEEERQVEERARQIKEKKLQLKGLREENERVKQQCVIQMETPEGIFP